MNTVTRDRLVGYLDEYLRVTAIEDDSPNGLQVQGRATVRKLALAVDASVQTIGAAAKSGADMLIVHHGLFWKGHQQIVGGMYKRMELLIKKGLSLYAAHLPLDCHQEIGNAVELARLFGLEVVGRFAPFKGTEVGILTRSDVPIAREDLKDAVEKALASPAELLPFGPKRARRIGIIPGDAAMFAEEARHLGCDALITGESNHAAYHMARDAGINVVFGGHYATETVGLRALQRHLEKKFGLSCKFVPAPTGY
jgi:dinuclear metal center YbgI/SA1388 family protein